MLDTAIRGLLDESGASKIYNLIERKIVTVYDYSYNGFSIEELTGGYFANLLGTIKHRFSYPLFDSISSDIVSSVINDKILDLSKTDKEIIRHAGIANSILSTLPTLEKATIDEILDFKKEMNVPLENFRKAIYNFSEKITSMTWDNDFQYECIQLYYADVIPKVNELNELSSNTSVLKNLGNRVLADEEERKKLGYMGAGLITTITTYANITNALGILENLIRSGAKIGLTAAGITAFLKTADLFNQAYKEVAEKNPKWKKILCITIIKQKRKYNIISSFQN